MSIITTAEVKTLANISVATYDTQIGNLIPAVQDSVEKYCDRILDMTTYRQWFKFDNSNTLVLPQYPVRTILYFGQSIPVADITISSGDITLEVKEDRITVINVLTETDFLFSAYATLSLIAAAIFASFPTVSINLNTTYNNTSVSLLRTSQGLKWYIAERVTALVRIVDNTDRILEIGEDVGLAFTFANDWYFNEFVMVAWKAGYDTNYPAPMALKLIMSNIINDIIVASNKSISGIYKSETIKNYSYTIWDPTLIHKEMQKYLSDLEPFVKKCF